MICGSWFEAIGGGVYWAICRPDLARSGTGRGFSMKIKHWMVLILVIALSFTRAPRGYTMFGKTIPEWVRVLRDEQDPDDASRQFMCCG